MSYFNSQSTPTTLSTSASASSLQHDDELDIMMSCYTDETMELDMDELFSPDTFWEDDDAGDSDGSTAMELLPFTDSYDSFHATDTLASTSSSSSMMTASTSSFFFDPRDPSARKDNETIAQELREMEQKLAASMKRSEASRARILELKLSRLATSKSMSVSSTTSTSCDTIESTIKSTEKVTKSMSAHGTDADKTAAFLIESRTSLTAALEQSRQQLSRFSSSALCA